MNRTATQGTLTTLRPHSDLPELVTAAHAGDGHAWAALHHRFNPMLRATARRYQLNEADTADAVQATWVNCFQHLGNLREPCALPGWLATTCRREAISIARRAAKMVLVDDEVVFNRTAYEADPADGDDPASVILGQELSSLLHRWIADLSPRQQLVIRALVNSDEGYEQMAAALQVPVGSLGPTRQRAVSKLRLRFVEEGLIAA